MTNWVRITGADICKLSRIQPLGLQDNGSRWMEMRLLWSLWVPRPGSRGPWQGLQLPRVPLAAGKITQSKERSNSSTGRTRAEAATRNPGSALDGVTRPRASVSPSVEQRWELCSLGAGSTSAFSTALGPCLRRSIHEPAVRKAEALRKELCSAGRRSSSPRSPRCPCCAMLTLWGES